jgi:hypothetical protein
MDVEGIDLVVDPFTATPAALLNSVVDLEPGPFLMGILLMVDRSSLGPDDAVTFLQLHERVAAWWAALQADAMVAAAGSEPRMEQFLVLDPRPDHHEERLIRIEEAAREEVGCALRLSSPTAQRRIDQARLLTGPLIATREALSLGEITSHHVAVITDEAGRLSGRYSREPGEAAAFEDACRRLEARVLPVARRGTVSRTRTAARRAAHQVDPAGQQARRRAARCTRDVWVMDDDDGISTLLARLDSLTAHAIMAAVADAAQSPSLEVDGHATAGERRAAALAAVILSSTPPSNGRGHGSVGAQPMDQGQAQGRDRSRVGVNLEVTISLADLLGAATGYGTLGASTLVTVDDLRAMLDDPGVPCTLRRLVTDPLTGGVIDVGRRRYDVTGQLRQFIVRRDRTCRFPGCGRRAITCQIDHALAWEDGGRTDAENLGALCVRHHQLKTHGGWELVESRVDGGCAWRSPLGRRYERPPEAVAPPSDISEADRPTDPDPPPF